VRLRDLAIVLGLALLALLFWKLRVIDPGTTLANAGPPWKLSMGNGDMFGQIYPGWKASVDGDAQPIQRANYLFRAVRVPAGRHTVRFRYQPTSFRAGAAISLAALTGILLLFRARPRESRDPIFEASPDS
jgi:vacuolar-type H+-ATPase catalytic subunit A/Vma1